VVLIYSVYKTKEIEIMTPDTSSIFDAEAVSLADGDFDAALLDAVTSHWTTTFAGDERRDDLARALGVSPALGSSLGIGLSDRTLGLRIPSRELKAGRLLRERLEALGILRPSGHEAFRGCVVVPVRREGRVIAVFARRIDRTSSIQWASGLPGGVFAETVTSSTGVRDGLTSLSLVTTSILDALAVLGALAEDDEELFDGVITVLAPARPRGYAVKDLKEITARHGALTVLGRDGDELVDRLREHGAAISPVGRDINIARTLTSSERPARVLAVLLDGKQGHAAQPVGLMLSAPLVDDPGPDDGGTVADALPSIAAPVITMTSGHDETYVQLGTRSWRLRGARARGNVEGDRLSVALSVVDQIQGRFHLDTLDLYSSRQRSSFLDVASRELRVERATLVAEMIHVLSAAEVTRDDSSHEEESELVEMTAEQRRVALDWLKGPNLLERLEDDLGHLGVVGEHLNLLVCYLAALSRKCERPIGVLVQSSSAGGKSTLVEAATALVPPEDLVSLSAITSQALYYLGGMGLRHKVLFVAEERGSSRADYALKLLVSEGRLSIASTGKDSKTGRLRTRNYETLGPLSLMMTTTATTLDPELENRLVVLGVDENPVQTRAIIAAQRDAVSLQGLAASALRAEVRLRHHDIQRLLEPMAVVIPEMTAEFPSSATRHRRDHAKLLSMIAVITLLHQHQRERRTLSIAGVTHSYLEATSYDVEVAVRLCSSVLARDTEVLAPQARRLLDAVHEHAGEGAQIDACAATEVDLTRRQMRELLGWSDTQVRAAADRLVALEYLVVSGGGRGRCRTYRLVPDFPPRASGESSHVGVVRGDGVRTSHGTSSGEERQFVEFVPFADVDERGTSYTDVFYPDTADSALPGVTR
jgi:hypothetical protein